MEDQTSQIYERVGGDAPFFALVERFYQRVEADAALRALYPEDLTAGKKHLALFLIQRFGGPAAYGEARGHPRLRMRHVPFQIGPDARDSWLRHMLAAVDAMPEFQPFRGEIDRYFTESANFLVNQGEMPQS